jgi:hypothetical protein
MFSVRYKLKGGFGNSVFAYALCAIYQKMFNFTYVLTEQPNELEISDYIFLQIFNKNTFQTKQLPQFSCNICFCGWFQHDYIFAFFKNEILEFIQQNQQPFFWAPPNNSDWNTILVHDFLPNLQLQDNDLVIHLRLDDFIFDKNGIVPFHLSLHAYKKLVHDFYSYFNLTPGNIIWVMDKPKMPEEFIHLDFLLTEIGGIYEPHSLYEDFCLIRKAKNLICSRSTFGWTAAALSTSKQNLFLPGYNTSLDQPHESFFTLHDKTFTYDFNSLKCSTSELYKQLYEWKNSQNHLKDDSIPN